MCRIELLEKKRLIKGLSYTEIAKQLGIHKVTVSRTLRGETMKSRTVVGGFPACRDGKPRPIPAIRLNKNAA